MPYIVNRSNMTIFSKQPTNKDNKYIPNKLPSQTKDPAPNVCKYPMHDLNSVFTHWDDKLKRNVSTPNVLPDTENKIDDGGVK